jgi:hypothetical protein
MDAEKMSTTGICLYVIFVPLKSIIYLIRDSDSHELLAGVIGLRLFLLQAGFLLKWKKIWMSARISQGLEPEKPLSLRMAGYYMWPEIKLSGGS